MSKKSSLNVDVGASAKLEVKTRVPAKSAGRLVDALTDIIRPFTEARGLKADRIRLQREDVAIQIAQKARERLASKSDANPVPLKVLIPLLEKGSLEEPNDSEMIERWSALLASAAEGKPVEPRLVSILGELSGRQAKFLRELALLRVDEVDDPGEFYGHNVYTNDARHFFAVLDEKFRNNRAFEKKEFANFLSEELNTPGAIADVAYIDFVDKGRLPLGIQLQDEIDFISAEICVSLGLVAREALSFNRIFKVGDAEEAGVLNVVYFHISLLGNELLKLCDPAVLARLDR